MIERLKTWTFWAILISCFIVSSVIFFAYYDVPKFLIAENFKGYIENVRNVLMGLVPLIGFPIIVWGAETACKQAKTAAEQKETAKKSLQETENNNRRTQENKIFVDCITHLASDKETIRTASIHGFGELLGNLENGIKNLSEIDIRKQERINFQDKILNILWSFMVEHSRAVLKLKVKDETSQEYTDAKEHINALYHPQFRFIMELLAKYRPHTYTLSKFWTKKDWRNIYLQQIDLSGANLNGGDLSGANLNGGDLIRANLNGADLSGTDLSETNLRAVDLRNAVLKRIFFSEGFGNGFSKKASSREEDLGHANLSRAKYNNATIFPDGFDREIDTKKHNMINIDEQKPIEEAK